MFSKFMFFKEENGDESLILLGKFENYVFSLLKTATEILKRKSLEWEMAFNLRLWFLTI